ncbi:MAG: hypothetical protein AAGK74_05000, partial [Chloroflexota bacterium]
MRDLLLAVFMLFAPVAQIDTAYTVEPVPEFADLRTVVFEGNVAEDAPSGEFQIHLGADCSAARLASTTDLIETDGDTRFRVTANAEAVAGYDRLAAALCVDAIDEPLSVQSFVLRPEQSLWRNALVSFSAIGVYVVLILLFENLNGRPPPQYANRWFALAMLLSAGPVLWVLVTLNTIGVDMVIADDWDRYYFGSYVASGQYPLHRHIAYSWGIAHEGHRMFMPALFNSLLANLTNANIFPRYFFNVALAFTIPLMMYSVVRRYITSQLLSVVAMTTMTLLLFNPAVQHWTEARFFHKLICVASAVGVFWALAVGKKNMLTYCIALVLALVSSLSFFPGNFVWPLAVPMLWIAGYRDWRYYAVGVVATSFVYGTLYFDIQNTLIGERADLPTLQQTLRGMFQFVTMPFLDLSIVEKPGYLLVEVGLFAILLLSLYTVLRSGRIRQQAVPLTTFVLLAGWGVLNGAAVVFSRLTTFGGTNAPRYEIYGVVFWCGVIGAIMVVTHRRNRLIMSTVLAGLVLCYGASLFLSQPLKDSAEIPRILRWCILEEEPRTDACNDAIGMHSINWYVEQPKVFWMVQRRTAAFEVDSYRLMPVHTGTGWNEWVREAFSPNSPDKPTPATVDTTVYEREIAGEPVHAVRATDDLYWEVYVPRHVGVSMVTQPVDGPGTYIVQVHLLT